jgi:hypothetical protein
MSTLRCPGQDPQFWKPEDIFNVRCPACGSPVEFFKDDPERNCPKCGRTCRNPRLDLACLAWCKHADDCRPETRTKEEEPQKAQEAQKVK